MQDKIPFNKKLVDTIEVSRYGRVDQYWVKQIIYNVFKGSRKDETPDSFRFYDPYFLISHFGLRGFEFGNWLNQEDRYVYMAGAAFAIKDFCECLGIRAKHFGLNSRINIAFGARGYTRSLAHFEPHTWAINLTRYREDSKGPNQFFSASGAGSLGHEYAHALDFYAGRYIDKASNFNYCSEILQEIFVRTGRKNGRAFYVFNKQYSKGKISPLRQFMIDGLGQIMYKQVGEGVYADSDFYHNLKEELKGQVGMGDYWQSIVEVWARSYEVFLFKKCEQKGIQESYLKKKKYGGFLYPKVELFTPEIEKAFIDFTRTVTADASEPGKPLSLDF